ncbi:MAG: DUF134 domain-containing protein [Lachnospiraceae bacterium]|nr:DUF134 domain-containing protein [Lachnospiraceae bacterium]
MPRPKKCRKVCSMPARDVFAPVDGGGHASELIEMSVDEYEVIRLIDLKGYTQEECAEQMDISRTTVTGIYNDARKKLAEMLVNGKKLKITGGDIALCSHHSQECAKRHYTGCCRRRKAAEAAFAKK